MSAIEIIDRLRARGAKLVCAESCTGGALAAALTAVPGASAVFCGSAITYREETKEAWLGVNPTTLERFSAVSAETTREMALGALKRTPEADYAIAVTGHYGPNAPDELDGVVFCCIVQRISTAAKILTEHRWQLTSTTRNDRREETLRRIFVTLDEVA